MAPDPDPVLVNPKSEIKARFANTIKKGDLVKPDSITPNVPSKKRGGHVKHYQCSTQAKSVPGEQGLYLGWNGIVGTWKSKSVIKFVVHGAGFPNPDDAVYAAHQLNAGAKMWNDVDIGVTFEWVERLEDAAFVLAYGGNDGGTLARAFFPNTSDLSTMFVYSRAFDADTVSYQSNIFAHELGHVLGLRHEFAQKEGGSVIFGDENEVSVMSYEFPPEIQESDIENTRKLYKVQHGKKIGGFPVRRYEPNN